MMAGVVAVSFALLVEVKTYMKIFSFESRVHVEARIAGCGERADKAHLATFLPLERISGAAEEIDGVVSEVIYGEFHSRDTRPQRYAKRCGRAGN